MWPPVKWGKSNHVVGGEPDGKSKHGARNLSFFAHKRICRSIPLTQMAEKKNENAAILMLFLRRWKKKWTGESVSFNFHFDLFQLIYCSSALRRSASWSAFGSIFRYGVRFWDVFGPRQLSVRWIWAEWQNHFKNCFSFVFRFNFEFLCKLTYGK